ncbi:MAG: hypothetical protein K9M54_05990 [Kiritimatiellales bacterium]|nr:hypothetical protein [Kiritimatiellales bacterium]MCF7864245.1 hypothetical protein [Kiritimatiellales bacterium]
MVFVSVSNVKAINHIEQNRPVHLALRDIYYERAILLLRSPNHNGQPGMDVCGYEEILFLLRTAREHGRFAVRDGQKNEKDGEFCDFINMLAGNMKAALSMLNLKRSVEAENGFFFSFLEVNHASVALQAEEYERRARDLIRCMRNTLELANGAYEGLKQANRESFNDFECERYDKAWSHYAGLIEKVPELPSYKKSGGLLA